MKSRRRSVGLQIILDYGIRHKCAIKRRDYVGKIKVDHQPFRRNGQMSQVRQLISRDDRLVRCRKGAARTSGLFLIDCVGPFLNIFNHEFRERANHCLA